MSDLTSAPDYVYEETIQHQTLISKFESGYEQRRAKWSAPLRSFHLVYNNRTASEMGTIKSLFLEKQGQATSFNWTNPNDSTSYVVRFNDDSFKFSMKAYGVYDFSFDITQVK